MNVRTVCLLTFYIKILALKVVQMVIEEVGLLGLVLIKKVNKTNN